MLRKSLVALAIPALCLGLSDTQEQDEWVCGNAAYSRVADDWVAERRDAGIVLLEGESLDYLRLASAERARVSDVMLKEWDSRPFDSLFCSRYLMRYRTPSIPSRIGGVCIRNDTVGARYSSILEADANARTVWEWFGTSENYQRSAPKVKDLDPTSEFVRWGTGHSGTSPANWCSAYMREMLCHIAFPQFAGTEQDLHPSQVSGRSYQDQGARVRPVCRDACLTLMDNCNRREPNPASQILPQIVEASTRITANSVYNTDDADVELSNSNWCKIWNKGVGVAQVCIIILLISFRSDNNNSIQTHRLELV